MLRAREAVEPSAHVHVESLRMKRWTRIEGMTRIRSCAAELTDAE